MSNSLRKEPHDFLHHSFESFCQSYLRYYAAGNSTTARGKKTDLHYFLSFLASYCGYSKEAKLVLADWSSSSTEAFVRDRLDAGEAIATVARRLATLKHFGKTLEERYENYFNPAKSVKTPKKRKTSPVPKISIDSIDKIAKKRIDDKDTFIRVRNRMIFLFLVETGLRPEEVRELKFRQLDGDMLWINSVRTKSGNYRNIPLSSKIHEVLQDYLVARTEELKRFFQPLKTSVNKELPLFISNYGANQLDLESFQMGAKTLWRAVHELSGKKKLHPHMLRHVFATELVNSAENIASASSQLGHTDLRLTKKYLKS